MNKKAFSVIMTGFVLTNIATYITWIEQQEYIRYLKYKNDMLMDLSIQLAKHVDSDDQEQIIEDVKFNSIVSDLE